VDLSVIATDDDGIDRYEYRWNRGTIGSVRTTDAAVPVVSFASLRPETRYVLQVRAVDTHGWASEWVLAADVVTPKPPTIIVAGDSIASGYHRQWFSSGGDCLDRDYSYGQAVQQQIASQLPTQWAPSYRNVAWAGAGLGAMKNGGTDSCGEHHDSQLVAIRNAANADSWNIVVVTAGINSTNWSSVIADLTKNTAFSLTERGDKAACASAVTNKWNLAEKVDAVSSAASTIVKTLTDETNASLFWTSYYTINGSRLAPGWTPIGAECDSEMATAMGLLHSTLRQGLGDRVGWVDIDLGHVPTQDWGGWPHPDGDGQRQIGQIIASAIS
jgi:hypothetical protein